LLIDENADAEYPAELTISYFPYSTVSFDTDGGNAIESVVVTNGNTVELPAQPTKAPSADCKYEFIGWYFNESEWDFNTPITEDITLVAKWKEVERVTIAQVEEAINALPYSASMPTNLSKVPAIMNASALYNELTEGEKAQVGNASKLESLLAAIQGYETVYVPDEYGVKVKCLLDPAVKLGDWFKLESEMLPIVNGFYQVYELTFDFATREPQYYVEIYGKNKRV
jgi:hypothetical protein